VFNVATNSRLELQGDTKMSDIRRRALESDGFDYSQRCKAGFVERLSILFRLRP
jgi:hypothetical protein